MLNQLSNIAPKGLVVKPNQLKVADKLVKNYLVIRFPFEYGLGFISFCLNNPAIKIYLKTDNYKGDYQKFLRKEYREIKEKLDKTQDRTLQQRYSQQLDALDMMIGGIVWGNDRVLDVKMVISVTADTKEDLRNLCEELKGFTEQQGMYITAIPLLQEELLKLTSPLFIKSGIDAEIEKNYGVPVTSSNFAGMWPYNFPKLEDKGGMLFGREKNNFGMIKWNPYYYKDYKEEAFQSKRSNSGIVILGGTGSGKTATAGKIYRYFARRKFNIISFDPEDKNYYLTKQLGGKFLSFGSGETMINLFDLKPIASEEDEDDEKMWNTEIAIYNVIDDFKTVLRLYDPELPNNVFNIIDELVINMYANKNITFDTEFRTLKAKDYPILQDLDHEIDDKIEKLEKTDIDTKNRLLMLKNAITPMLLSHKFIFNGHTTVQLSAESGQVISFGTKNIKNKERNLRNALYHIIFKFIWSAALDKAIPSVTLFDEGHEYILEGNTAKEISSIYRRSRKYNNTPIFITQEPGDLTADVVVDGVAVAIHGKAIMNNSAHKIIMMLEKDAVNTLDKLINLNENELNEIKRFVTGDALFVVGNMRYLVNILASKKELDSIDPTRDN